MAEEIGRLQTLFHDCSNIMRSNASEETGKMFYSMHGANLTMKVQLANQSEQCEKR
jgi:hypothetical protein